MEHHLSGRAHSIRWNPNNASCHCKFTNDPVAHRDFIMAAIGQDMYETLTVIQDEPMFTYALSDKKDMYEHYKQQKKTMLQKRKDGVLGYLEFEAFD